MKITEVKGDVTFYEDDKGNQFQQIKDGEIFKVRDGRIVYRYIKQVNGYKIKYNTNGLYGFCVFRGRANLEDRIWTLDDAERIAREL